MNSTTKQPKIKPAEVFPDLMRKLVKLKVLADEIQEELTQQDLGTTLGVSHQSIDAQIQKYKKQREAKA